MEALLDRQLEQHKDLVQGELPNGLKYVILPNQVPPERFEAHLEICAGVCNGQALVVSCTIKQRIFCIACNNADFS